MLENLRKVQWPKLEIANGTAETVPDLIEALTSDDPDVNEEALLSLNSSIYEQGIVFDSTIAAVPFLLEILQAGAAADPAGIIDLLAQIAESRDIKETTLVPAHEYTFMPETGEEYVKDEEEMQWSQQAYDEVAKGMPIYRALLNDDDPTVRTSAAALLELFPETALENAAALQQAIEVEDDIPAMSDLMFSLRDVLSNAKVEAAQRTPYAQFFRSIFEQETEPTLRLGAAIAVVQLDGALVTSDMIDVIREAVIDPAPYSEYIGDTLENPVYEALPALVQVNDPDARTRLLGTLKEISDPRNARSLALALLVSVFGEEPLRGRLLQQRSVGTRASRRQVEVFAPADDTQSAPQLRTTLTPEQREVVEAILNSDAFWITPSNLLSVFGLPALRNDLLEYLENPEGYSPS